MGTPKRPLSELLMVLRLGRRDGAGSGMAASLGRLPRQEVAGGLAVGCEAGGAVVR